MINKKFLFISTIATLFATSCVSSFRANQKQTSSEPTTVANVDLDTYQGRWYEIGRIPMYFQRKCANDVTATYTKRADGKINVINKCIDKSGKQMIATGLATVDKKYPHANNSKLLVSFLPTSLRWLPVGKGSYWIIALDMNDKKDDYTHVMVGSPNHKYLWILSRTPNMPEKDYQKYLNIAKAKGYDTDSLIRTKHTQ